MHRFAKLVSTFACTALLAACASLPDAVSPLGEGAFEVSGRVAIRYGKEAATGRIDWRHTTARDEMLITNPLGQGIATLTRSDGEVILKTADSRTFNAQNAEELTGQVLGWQVPLDGLPFWIRARAASNRAATLGHDDQRRVITIEQDGWRIDLQDYEGERPTRFVLRREGLEIRLFVDRWTEGNS